MHDDALNQGDGKVAFDLNLFDLFDFYSQIN